MEKVRSKMNKPQTEKAIRFMAMKPTLIGRVRGYDFYEHPEYGDESPLRTITPDGRVKKTEFYELPTAAEFIAY